MTEEQKPQREDKLSFWEVLTSTLAAAIGVQSRRKMERDLTYGEILQFVVAGLIFTVVFIVGVILVVNLVVSN